MKKLCFFVLAFFVISPCAFSQKKMQGDIVIIEGSEASWQSAQKEFLKSLDDVISSLKEKKTSNFSSKFSDETLNQVSGAYLTCSKMQGPCEFILKTLLTLDAIRSKNINETNCFNTKYFWKTWMDNNYEKQALYDLNIAILGKFEEFRTQRLKNYIKCEDSIKNKLKTNESINDNLPDMEKTRKVLFLLWKKYGDITLLYNNDNNGQGASIQE